ncbi:hypothetical protein [Rheinheimera sp. EpRS3]|uniref:hypothetical protein n=1 Tax=Rheinheimera sp. EpRS3 TaxID=1712383 RepID=UPI000AF7ADD4|nr:hypothetical protein [Rheinheimera sp. EpRS3]
MRLYILDSNNQKVQLGYDAQNRKELARLIGSAKFKHGDTIYAVNQVQAESDSTSVIPAAVGALVGVLGGGVGLAIGGTIGALVGENLVKEDKQKATTFNASTAE